MRFALAVAALLLALGSVPFTPARAQQSPLFTPKQTVACLNAAKGRDERGRCIGASADACRLKLQSPSPGDVALCQTAEAEYWAKRAQAAFGALQEKAAALDERFNRAVNTTAAPFRLTDDLARQRAAWEAYRDATCAVETMLRRGTPYKSTAAAQCMMELNGAQALFLEDALAYR